MNTDDKDILIHQLQKGILFHKEEAEKTKQKECFRVRYALLTELAARNWPDAFHAYDMIDRICPDPYSKSKAKE